MSRLQGYAWSWFLCAAGALAFAPNESATEVEGVVVDDAGPVPGASVRRQGSSFSTLTDHEGRFHLPRSFPQTRVAASKRGYRIVSAPESVQPLSLQLVPWPKEDHPDYTWIEPHPDPVQRSNCANCHAEIYGEWKASGHGRSATNPRFLRQFSGSDGVAPVSKWWNVQAEYPDGAGLCAVCHAPTLRSPTLDYDVRQASGVARSGVHCDYCHKVVDAPTDRVGTRLGRDGLRLLRPAETDFFSLGPLDDAHGSKESFGALPLFKESRFCASCHEGTIFGVHAYGTYSEWLESPARARGLQCQNCHMSPTGQMTNIAPGQGGVKRNPMTLASHHTPGAESTLLRQCLSVRVKREAVAGGHRIEVETLAERVGHRTPTGSPDRQLILIVHAYDERGQPLDLVDGPRLPASAGTWKDAPGRLYAKQLFDDNGHAPTPFWRHVANVVDTRLFPGVPDRRTFAFPATTRRVTVQLWYRRFWQELAVASRWTDNDLLVLEITKQ